jgi:cell wall-associated NlpC family hydrolase
MNKLRFLKQLVMTTIVLSVVFYNVTALAVADIPDEPNNTSLTVSEGMESEIVTTIQSRLMTLEYMVLAEPTNYFDETTRLAVQQFQENNLLIANGVIDQQTYDVLISDSAVRATVIASGSGIESLISVAESKLGCKYVRTAKGPNAFDCSGFVYWCLNQVGIDQGYMTSRTWASSTKYTKITSISEMQRGDIVVYSGHVAIYAGDGVIIDASASNGKVVKRTCTSPWYNKNFICAFRVF